MSAIAALEYTKLVFDRSCHPQLRSPDPGCQRIGGGLKTRDWKTQDWKTWDQIAGVENAGLENAGTSFVWV